MHYKLFLILMILTALFFFSCKEKEQKPLDKKAEVKKEVKEEKKDRLAQTKGLAKEFMKSMVSQLKAAIKEGGPVKAIGVCKKAAPKAYEEFKGKDSDILSFRRISLKVRNKKDDVPTEKEAAWLKTTEEQVKNGEKAKPGKIEESDKVTVLLPITIQKEACLKCHGDTDKMSKELIETIKANYPEDEATGYKLHDFRGALAVQWKK